MSDGELIDSPSEPIAVQFYSFKLIRETFNRLGMKVVFSAKSKPRHNTIAGAGGRDVTMSDQEIELVHGLPGTVNSYTGEIEYVGERHIEYDFDAFTGRMYFYAMRASQRLSSNATLVRPSLSILGLTESWWIGTMAL